MILPLPKGEGRGEGESSIRLPTGRDVSRLHFAAAAPLLLFCSSLALARAVAIPDRPEKLTFPPLVYEPPAPERFRVQLKTGPVAYVVPDHDLPLVNFVFSIHTGKYLDPAGKEGLGDLTGYLLARGGTKSKTAEELEERLAFLAAQLNSGVHDTEGSVSLNLLSKDLDEGLAILREVLTAPRFQDDKIALRKQQMLQEMEQRNDDSSEIEGREHGFLAFGDRFWANHYSTKAVFAETGVYLVDKDVNQGRVAMMLPGIKRDNPDYFGVLVMNDILGGGGFISRIVNSVRSDEGLAYDAHSSFPGGVYYPLTFTAGFQSKSRTVAYAASIVLNELKKMAAEPVSEDELKTSKDGFIERFPRTFSTKAQVANTFAQDEFTGRYAKDPGYWKQYRSRLQKVGAEEILRVAKKYLTPDKLVILVVGQKADILLGYPSHPVKLADLAGGHFKELPLRDPMTMQPMPLSAQEKTSSQ